MAAAGSVRRGRFFYVRELTDYPTGRRRLWMLFMAVLASLVANYESQIAPVVPLLLRDLHMSLTTYGLVSAASVAVGAITAALGGRLSDTWGRVTLLIPTLILTALCNYAMLLVSTPGEFLVARSFLSFIEGASITITAGLVRDFSPRMSRATSLGFWTWGPVGANFMAATIAAVTLPIFLTWQSQFVIVGTIALVLSLLIASQIADLSPELRAKIITDEGEGAQAAEEGATEEEKSGRVRELLRHPHMWAHMVGIALWLVTYYTLMTFGPTMMEDTFGMEPSRGSAVMSAFWVLNILALVVAGRLSDRWRARRPVSLFGAAGTLVMVLYFMSLMDGHPSDLHIMVVGALIGGFMGVTYVAWMANFSEDAEDVKPSLQGTAWGLWGLIVRVQVVAFLVICPIVVEAASWHTWMWIAVGTQLVYLPALLMFKGPWRPRGHVAVATTPAPAAAD